MSGTQASAMEGTPTGAFSLVSAYRAQLGESPAWCPDTQSLWWVDCASKALVNTRPDGAETVWPAPQTIGFVVLAFGRILAGLETGLFAFDPPTGRFEQVMALDAPALRFNDAAVGLGHIWASTMDRGVEQPIGEVLRIGPHFKPFRCLEGYRRPNGLAADPARLRLYVSDSHPRTAGIAVASVDPSTFAIDAIAPFSGGPARPGRPDGAALDAMGNYWIARVDAGLIDVMAPNGDVLGSVPVPVPEPTKPAFGGPDMRTLFVTSKASGELGGRLLAAYLDDIWPDGRV